MCSGTCFAARAVSKVPTKALRFPWSRFLLLPVVRPRILLAAGSDDLAPPWPDLVIGCGRLAAIAALAVKQASGGRIRLGNPVIIRGRDAPVEAEEACAMARGRLVAIGAIEASWKQIQGSGM